MLKGLYSEETKYPPDELIKHLFSGFQLLTMTRLARTTGRVGMNLGDKSARVYLGLTLGLRTDKRPAWKQLWFRRKQPVYNSVNEKERERGASPQKSTTKNTMRLQ